MTNLVRRAVSPLWSGRTWRGFVHLVMGGALLVPFWVLGFVLVGSLAAPEGGWGLVWAVAVIFGALPGAWLVGFSIPAFRSVSIVATRDLLDVPLEDLGTDGGARSPRTRQRTGVWAALHLGLGGVVCGLTLIVVPGAAYLLIRPIVEPRAEQFLGVADEVALPVLGALLLVGLAYLIVVCSWLLRWVAPTLLGPSPDDRLAALERQAERLAERNRLARELHDSVGHALSIITVQAAAARRVQEADPAFAGQALSAIEDASRSALEDLDHVLGVLRADAEASLRPQPTLADLDRLVATTRAAGVELATDVRGPLGGVPPVVSREAYRIAQEGLTNAVRHGGDVRVVLAIDVGVDTLAMEVTNPIASPVTSGVASGGPPGAGPGAGAGGGGGRRRGGRGLRGIRERVTVLRGEMSAGVEDGRWRLAVTLPLRSPR